MAATTISLTEFLPLVRPHCAEAATPLILQSLRLAAMEYCERTRCWRYITTIALTANGLAVACPAYATIHEFERVSYSDGSGGSWELKPISYSEIPSEDFLASATEAAPEYVTQDSPNTVAVYPFTATGTLEMSLFLKPRNDNTIAIGAASLTPEHAGDVVPDFLFIKHGEAIAHGALARIFSIPQQEFSNGKLALYHGEKFSEAADHRFNNNIRGQQRARSRSRYNGF